MSHHGFDPKADAAVLKKSLHFIGTDTKAINGIFGSRSREQLQLVANEFAQENPHSLHHAIESACKFNYGALLTNLLKSPLQLKIDMIKHGVHKYIVDVLVPSSNVEILELYQADPKTIAELLTSAHFSFAKCVEILLKGRRDETFVVDDPEAQKVAETLYKAGEGKLGTDDDTFINVITGHSVAFLKAVSVHYAAKHNHSLEAAIKKETGGDYERLLVGCLKTKYEYFADRLYEAMHGLGTDDRFLVYAFSVLHRSDLHAIIPIYKERHQKDLLTVVKGDTSGHYEELLILLLS